jgi:hypothetical protein
MSDRTKVSSIIRKNIRMILFENSETTTELMRNKTDTCKYSSRQTAIFHINDTIFLMFKCCSNAIQFAGLK